MATRRLHGGGLCTGRGCARQWMEAPVIHVGLTSPAHQISDVYDDDTIQQASLGSVRCEPKLPNTVTASLYFLHVEQL